MLYNDETNPKTDLANPHIWWNTLFCSNGSWIDESSA